MRGFRDIRELLVLCLGVVTFVEVLRGELGSAVAAITTLLAALTDHIRAITIAVTVPVLLLGGLVFISPWQRRLGLRLLTGALIALAIAELGPPFMHWFDAQLQAHGRHLLGSGT